jgi:hypothetical protein
MFVTYWLAIVTLGVLAQHSPPSRMYLFEQISLCYCERVTILQVVRDLFNSTSLFTKRGLPPGKTLFVFISRNHQVIGQDPQMSNPFSCDRVHYFGGYRLMEQ